MNRITYLKLFIVLVVTITSSYSHSQPNIFENKGIGGGGTTIQPSISPHDDQVYYLTSDMSPIFKTENAGSEWNQIPFYELTSFGQHTRIEFTSNPNILYSFGFTSYPNPFEPKKSIDGGQTWDILPSDPTNGGVIQLLADPTTTNRLILSNYNNLFISLDGGSTFQTIYTATLESVYIGGVFWDGDDIYIGLNNTGEGGHAILMVSNDGGETFTQENINDDFQSNHYFRSMEGVNVNGQVKLYAVTTAASWGGYAFTQYWGPTRDVLRLEYGISSAWESLNGNNLNLANYGGTVHPNIIATSTSDPNVVYLGAYDAPGMEVYKSINGGDSWSLVFDGENTNSNNNINTGWFGAGAPWYNWWWSGPVTGLDVSNSNSDIIIITDFTSSHHSRDGALTWDALYVRPEDLNAMGSNTPASAAYQSNGLELTSSWHLNWISPTKIFASYTDVQGFISNDGGDSWSSDYSYPEIYNTTYKVIHNPSNNKLYACVSDTHDMYGSGYVQDANIDGGTGEIFESSDSGDTWTVTHDFGKIVIDMTIDSNNPNRYYACVPNSINGGIYYSNDYGQNWELLNSPSRTEGHPIEVIVLDDGTLVAVYSGRLDNGQFTSSSGIFISQDNGNTWLDRSDAGMHYWTMDLEIDPLNDNLWYASVKSHWGPNNIEQGGLYRSYDKGHNWTRINSFYRAISMTIHPNNPNIAYVATHDGNEGLQYTNNLLDENPIFSRVESYHFGNPNRVFFNPYNYDEVWVTSFGNGLKKGISIEETLTINEFENSTVRIFPNPASGFVTIRLKEDQIISNIKLVNLLGQTVVNINEVKSNEYSLSLDKFNAGIYIVKVTTSDGKIESSKVIVN